MIKANELRIGNWLYDQGYYQITKIDGDEDTEPIPLTPEILDKCGFAKYDKRNYPLYAPITERYYRQNGVLIAEGFSGSYSLRDDIKGGSIYNCFFKYLHELQNLHFAITGKELEIRDFTLSGTALSGVQNH
jgi:hypothetical protein